MIDEIVAVTALANHSPSIIPIFALFLYVVPPQPPFANRVSKAQSNVI
jgi:hypothetical protein